MFDRPLQVRDAYKQRVPQLEADVAESSCMLHGLQASHDELQAHHRKLQDDHQATQVRARSWQGRQGEKKEHSIWCSCVAG